MLSTITAAAMTIMTAMLSINQLGELTFPTPAGRANLSDVPVAKGPIVACDMAGCVGVVAAAEELAVNENDVV